jgi:hypothetical protein
VAAWFKSNRPEDERCHSDEGRHSKVTISTELKVRSGLLGMLERALTSRFLRPTYIRELENLAALAEERSTGSGSG